MSDEFVLRHGTATTEKALGAAARVEVIVGKVMNRTKRAMSELDLEDLALLVQHVRDVSAGPRLEHAWAAAELLARPGWQPIATAPRDGSRFQLWYPEIQIDQGQSLEGFFVEGFFDDYDGTWVWSWRTMREEDQPRRPTHWMPLLTGPVTGSTAGQGAVEQRAGVASAEVEEWRAFAAEVVRVVHPGATGEILANHLSVEDLPDVRTALHAALGGGQ